MKSTGSAIAGSSFDSSQSSPSIETTEEPARFGAVLDAFFAGDEDLTAVRHELARVLYAGLKTAAVINNDLKLALDRGVLAAADYDLLRAEVQHMTTEEQPTDAVVDSDVAWGATGTLDWIIPVCVTRESESSSHGQPGAISGPTSEDPQTGPTPGKILKNRYQLEELVAEGPMGKVFRASDRLKQEAGANPAVAIKVPNPGSRFDTGAVSRLQHEALHTQRLAHPNIINVFDFDLDGEIAFMTMEWCVGESLAALLDRTRPRPLPMPEVQRIITGVAKGVSHVHDRGIVHGDIKPSNIFLSENGTVRIMDFGLAQSPAVPVTVPRKSSAAFAVTPGYASCELLEAEEPCVQDDVYALACTIYRMVAGFRPRGLQTALEAEEGNCVPSRPGGLTRPQWNALRSGLALRRNDRLPDIGALTRAFSGATAVSAQSAWIRPAIIALVIGLGIGAVIQPGIESFRPGTAAERYQAESVQPGPSRELILVERPAIAELPSDVPAELTNSKRVSRAAEAPPKVEVIPATDDPWQIEAAVVAILNDDDLAHGPEFMESAVDESVAVDVPVSIDEPAVVVSRTGFTANRYEVGESDGFVQLTVRAPSQITGKVPARLIVEPGSAVAEKDYSAPASREFEFEPGNSTEFFFIPLISDVIVEHIEEFTVRVESSSPDISFDSPEALIIIVDDD